MPIRGAEQSAEYGLAALLRGVGEFGHRARAAATPAEALACFLNERLRWLAADASGSRASEIALASYHADEPSGRLLAQAWRLGPATGKMAAAELMRAPLSTVFGSPTQRGGVELPMVRLELNESIFPTSEKMAPDAVAGLFQGFATAMSEFGPAEIPAVIQTLLAALETYAWCVSADGHPDVSIFELSRSVSAIASATAAGGQPGDRDYTNTELMLGVGDLGGIQRFLYGVVASKAARMLRGRSLGLQLIADAIGNHILARFQLPITNLLYSGGGKLWLLLPAAALAELVTLAEEVDLKLNQRFASRLSFGIGCAVVTLGELSNATSRLWQRATEDLARRRRRRFSEVLRTDYELVFAPFGTDKACRVCGVLSRDLRALSRDEDDDERLACSQCRDFVKLGQRATQTQLIIRLPSTTTLQSGLFRYSPGVGADDYLLYQNDLSAGGAPPGATVMWVNGPPKSWNGPWGHTMWLAGLNRAVDKKGDPLDFDQLAESSEGINRLGILRMDVDSLGRTLREGLVDRANLARIAALSRHLSYFFGGYLSSLLSRDEYAEKLQIIYSGGDDVFIVGAWLEIPLIAERIRRDFGRFTARNPAWGISAGIDIMPASFPVAAAAERAGEAEQRAKQHRRRSGKTKDAVCFLDEVFGWEEFEVLCSLEATLADLFPRHDHGDGLPRASLRKLHAIASEARRAGDIIDQAHNGGDARLIETAVRRGKWSWQAAYSIARPGSSSRKHEKLEELYAHLEKFDWRNSTSPRPLLWLLKPAAEWVDLLNRERR